MFEGEKDQISHERGQAVFRQGEPGEWAYVVLEGEVEIRSEGREIETLGPGGIFGEMALISKDERSADAFAKSDCRLAALDQRRFLFLVQQTPFFAIQVMQILSDRLRKTTERSLAGREV